METGERLRYATQSKNISIKELTERATISVPTLQRYINGLHSLSHFPAGKMDIVLDVFSDWLLGFDIHGNPHSIKAYTPANAIIKKIFENDNLEETISILADMPSDKL